MITFLAIVLFIWVVISNRSLSSRLDALELKIKNSDNVVTGFVKPVALTQNQPPLTQPATMTTVDDDTDTPISLVSTDRFAEWLKEDWLMKLGAMLFVIGFGWFVSYAFINNWIGPVGRISIGIVAGIAIMSFGFMRMFKYKNQGAVFMALGAGMAILTIFAGRSIYGFFTPVTAVVFDFLIVAFVSFASYRFNAKSLAYIAQVLAFLAPLLVAGSTDSIFLFSYLLVVSLATLVLAGLTGWRDLIVSSLLFVGLYSLPYLIFGGNYLDTGLFYTKDAPMLLNFAYVFSALYLFSGMMAVIKKGVQDVTNEIKLAVLNGLFLFVWVYFVALPEWSVILFTAWALVFAVSSFITFRMSEKLAPFYAYGSVAIAFVAAATAAQLDGQYLAIAFTLEVLLIVVSVLSLTKNTKMALGSAWLFLAPAYLSFESGYNYANSQELFTKDFFVLFFIACSLLLSGILVVKNIDKDKKDDAGNLGGNALVILGTLYVGYLVWHMIHISMINSPDLATMVALMIFTVVGLMEYFNGLYGNDMSRRTYGVAILSFVVLRLVLVDVWHMELFGRVVTFLAIGVLLMSTAFLTKKKKQESELIVVK